MTTSPRVSRFMTNWSDHDLDNAISIPAIPITLEGKDFIKQRELLFDAMRKIFLPDRQSRKIIREFISIACAHAEIHFYSDFDYTRGLYSKFPWGQETVPAFCFTGLAGTGKSEILMALFRLIGHTEQISVAQHFNLPLVAMWPLTVRDGVSLNTLLGPHVFPESLPKEVQTETPSMGQAAPRRPSISEILPLARKISWLYGVCLIPVDEFQFISQGVNANAKATGVLLKLLGVGPRLIVCLNFSMVHKLMKRDSQERQRLVTKPIILCPLGASDPDWVAFLNALKSVAPDVLVFDATKDAEKIHEYTYGIKRLAVELICTAFLLAKSRNTKAKVGIRELHLAFQSSDFMVNRKDVQDLQEQDIRMAMVRSDLWCPFQATSGEYVEKEGTGNDAKVKEAKTATQNFERRTEDALLQSALTPGEAAASKSLFTKESGAGAPAKLIRFRGRKTTKDDLLQGAALLANLD